MESIEKCDSVLLTITASSSLVDFIKSETVLEAGSIRRPERKLCSLRLGIALFVNQFLNFRGWQHR